MLELFHYDMAIQFLHLTMEVHAVVAAFVMWL